MALVLAFLSPVEARADRAAIATARLERDWGINGDWRGINAWQRFVIADGLIDWVRRSGARRLLPRLSAIVSNRAGLDGNDDDLWAVLAEVHLQALTGDQTMLASARATFDGIVAAYWDDRCGGGLWWDHARTYKNAITNELMILAAADLYQATGKTAYRDWAERGWRWFAASGLIGGNDLVNDGLDVACRNNGGATYTYNQGVIVGALRSLAQISGDRSLLPVAARIGIAATRTLVDANGILREPVDRLNVDAAMFKGILVFHLGHLTRALPAGQDRTTLRRFLICNAGQLWRRSGHGARRIPALWDGSADDGGASAQASGIDLFVAASR